MNQHSITGDGLIFGDRAFCPAIESLRYIVCGGHFEDREREMKGGCNVRIVEIAINQRAAKALSIEAPTTLLALTDVGIEWFAQVAFRPQASGGERPIPPLREVKVCKGNPVVGKRE